MGIFSSCTNLIPEETPIAVSETATITPTVTATIIWFPATETPTPFPTRQIEPTVQMAPGLGGLLLTDAFSVQQEWRTGTFNAGNIIQVDDSLTLAVQQPKSSLQTVLTGNSFANFDIQLMANVTLCRGDDAYGILIRSMSDWDYYRFLINCQGNVRAERIRNSQTIPLQDWTPTDIIPGAPVESKIEIWANGSEMRLLVNDVYIFTVKDPVFPNGQIGFYARSASENDVTVNFHDLTVRSIEQQSLLSSTPTP